MESRWLHQAVRNNAAWSRIIAASHGRGSYQTERAWVCEDEMPPLYPNLVTLDERPEVPREVDSLLATLSPGWGIKDSFASLDLCAYGFHELFAGTWFVREPARWPATDAAIDLPWERSPDRDVVRAVRTAEDLSRWIDRWGETPPGRRVFTDELLEEETVAVLYLARGGRMTAGLITNRSDQVVGISNTFGELRDIAVCIGHVAELHPSRAIVGYGDELQVQALDQYGFRSLGSLRVWVKGPLRSDDLRT